MQCVAEAVMEKGIRGLTEMVPGSNYLLDVASDALKRYKERRNREQIRKDLQQAAEATLQEARVAAEKIAREVGNVAESAVPLELYLAQIPSAIRRSLRRPEDPTGTTIPSNLRLETPADLVRRLPQQMPRFRAGQALPGRPGRKLVELLGTGGFGEVWRVDHQYANPWAVKFCIDPRARKFLQHEAEHVARVSRLAREQQHPHVVPLLEAELDSDFPWLAYELISDGDLTGLMLEWQSKPLAERIRATATAIKTLAETTGHFHTLKDSEGAPSPVVHRDLKPGNILVQKRGNGKPQLMVTDFGISDIAARVHTETAAKPTAFHVSELLPPGTCSVVYARHQQQRGDPPDPRDDVHAIGVIGYQMLTGRLDVAPPPRFDRELRDLGVPTELIDLLSDCIDHNESRQPANGLALSKRFPLKVGRISQPSGGQPVTVTGDGEAGGPKPEGLLASPAPEPKPLGAGAVTTQESPPASTIASGLLGVEVLLWVLATVAGAYIVLFDENTRDWDIFKWGVLYGAVMVVASALNWHFRRGQSVARRFRVGIGTAIISIYFAFALGMRERPDVYVHPSAWTEEIWLEDHESVRMGPLARGAFACVLQSLLTLRFVRTRPRGVQPTKAKPPNERSQADDVGS